MLHNNRIAEVYGQNLRRIRQAHKETQQELGEAIGYGATTIANYESGYRLPDLETFIWIARHYDVSLDAFFEA